MDEPWGWRIDGHYLNLNDFVLKDQGVMTPAFWGAEPATADRGPYAGLRECDAEQRNGLELIRALSLPQQKQAIIFKSIISTDLPPERYTPPDGCQQSVSFKDNVVIPYEGIRADALTPGQRYLLLTLIQTYTSHLRPGHDQVWLEEIKQHLSETWFAWMGGFGDNDVFIRRCTVRCCLLSLTWHALWALLNTFGESAVTPSAVGSRFTF
jgi:Protein of unknown function (DUF3500)